MPGLAEQPEMNGGVVADAGDADTVQDASEDCPEPQPGEAVMRIVSVPGTDSVEVEDGNQRRTMCALSPEVKDTADVIIGCFVLVKENDGVKTSAAGDELPEKKVIVKLYSSDQVRILSESSSWPAAFRGPLEESGKGVEGHFPTENEKDSVKDDGGDRGEPQDEATNQLEGTNGEKPHDEASNEWKGTNGVVESSAGPKDAGTSRGWEAAETSQSVLGPGPTDGEQPTEQKPAPPKELHTFFMIRIPKPPDSRGRAEIMKADLLMKEKADTRHFLNAAFSIKKVGRSEAVQKVRAAKEKARACGDAVRQKRDEMESRQWDLRKLKDPGRFARDRSRDLPSSEQELDERIANIEYRMQHESISLKEEKQCLREMKTLKASREEVCHYERLQAEFSGSVGEREQIQDRLKILQSELDTLKDEQATAKENVSAAESELEEIDIAKTHLQSQVEVAHRARQDAYEQRESLKREDNARNNEFYKCRREIHHVRQLAFQKDKKAVEELCNAQVERVMSMWNSNAEFRADYVKNNESSTLKRLQTFDGRALGPDEDPPLLSDDRNGSLDESRIEPEQAVPVVNYVKKQSADVDHAPGTALPDVQKKDRDPDSNSFAASNGRSSSAKAVPVSDGPLITKRDEAQEEEELIAAAKLKQKRREQEMAKAREAQERKKRFAERSQSKALVRAQKDAEKREKEKEKKAQKKAASLLSVSRESGPAAEAGSREAAESGPSSGHVQESPPPEVKPSGRQRRRAPPQKLKTKSPSLPSALSKKDSTRLPYWYWIAAVLLTVIILLALLPRFVQ